MYNCISDELVDSGIADKLSTPVWINATGEEVSIEDSFGCKVTHNIKHPDYVLVFTEWKTDYMLHNIHRDKIKCFS